MKKFLRKKSRALFVLSNSVIAFASFSPAFATNGPSIKIKNESSFYLHPKAGDSGTTCTKEAIEPGKEATLTDYWCGYIACATPEYSDEDGCIEPGLSPKGHETKLGAGHAQGGYATWFSISPGAKTCSVPDGNTYQCSITTASDGSLIFNLKYLSVTQKYSAGSKVGQVVKLPKISQYDTIPYRGVNISGLEYDGTFLDALFQLPDLPDVRYFAEQGMNTIRLPIRAEFVVTDANPIESHNPMSDHVNEVYMAAVKDTVKKYLDSGLTVVLDLHNYMRFCETGQKKGQFNEPTDPIGEAAPDACQLMTQEQFEHIWTILADQFSDLAKDKPDNLIFELVNEPYTHFKDGSAYSGQELLTQQLFGYEMAALKAIRSKGLNNYVMLSGNYWDPLHGWTTLKPNPNDPDPNGKVFTAENLKAAGVDVSRVIIDMHQYFNKKEMSDGLERAEYSGTSPTCFDAADANVKGEYTYEAFKQKLELDVNGVDVFGDWLKKNGIKVFLGEFGTADNKNCKINLEYMLRFIKEHAYDKNKPNDGGFVGWTAWRTNRHGTTPAFAAFNFLQQEDYSVYRAPGRKPDDKEHEGTGIAGGQGNGLMDSVFSKVLEKPSTDQ